MNLPPLVALPPSLVSFVQRADQSFRTVLGDAASQFDAWPAERLEAFNRVVGASDFVSEQATRDPHMLLALADSGELERPLQPGELRAQMADAVNACTDEAQLGHVLRRLRNRQQVRIIWRDVNRLADLAQT